MRLFRHQFTKTELIADLQEFLRIHARSFTGTMDAVEEFPQLRPVIGLTSGFMRRRLESMILIVTALMLEARPVREQLGLQALGNEPYPVFAGDNFILVVSGTGVLKASAATGWAMARFPGIRAAVNLGFAGAAESTSSLYKWHYIHAIRDQSNGRLYVPDILLRHAFP